MFITLRFAAAVDNRKLDDSNSVRKIDLLHLQTIFGVHMDRLESLDELKSITVHWSESNLINDELGCDDNCDIEKQVDPVAFDDLIKRAALIVGKGYDKTFLSVEHKNGFYWCREHKFFLCKHTKGLIELLNHDHS